jgi:formylglycine-generating enzyme required for sulfatase activity
LLILLGAVVIRAIRKRRRPQLSLGLLLLVTVAAGGCVLSGLHWRQSVRALEAARTEFAAAQARYVVDDIVEKPAHSVTLTKPFYMGKYDVTQEQYQQETGENPSEFKGKDYPVEFVPWYEARDFCEKMTEQTNQTARLPTEAEWEYSCRAGTTTSYHSGDAESDLARVAWYNANSTNTVHPVGQKEPNAFGLYDMHGNVCQWCQEPWFEANYGNFSFESGSNCVVRGGGFYYAPHDCRSAVRNGHYKDFRSNILGFRVVVELALKAP